MRTTKISLIAIAVIIIAACKTSKKVTRSTATSTPASATTTSANALPLAKSKDGIYAPGNEELVAIQSQYKDLTLDKLKEGHVLYTQSACIKCHSPKNIYKRDQMQWYRIVDDMALKAKISDTQKDAVMKYVLAIKATQPK